MEGGPEGYAPGETYLPIAVCVPMGFGLKKAFNGNAGIKLEAGFRFTNTDYLDDVSTFYYDSDKLNEDYGQSAAIMSGTGTGFIRPYIGYAAYEFDANGDPIYPEGSTPDPSLGGTNPYTTTTSLTEPGMQRGNPENNDGYMFVTLSAYKKLNNASKSYKTINMHQKRKIKASF
jgi:hypothetical protein